MSRDCGGGAARVFLSHNTRDKPFVRRLARALEREGFTCWLDEAEIHVGESLIGKISGAIEEIDLVIAVVSSNSVDSAWVRQELDWAMTREIEDRRVVVIPLVVDRCDIPFFLRNKLYADFSAPAAFPANLQRLAASMRYHLGRNAAGPHAPGPQTAGTARRFGEKPNLAYDPTFLPLLVSGSLIVLSVAAIGASHFHFDSAEAMRRHPGLEGRAITFFSLVVAASCAEVIRSLLVRYLMRVDPVFAQDAGGIAVANLLSRRYRRLIWRYRREPLFMVSVFFEVGILVVILLLAWYALKIMAFL